MCLKHVQKGQDEPKIGASRASPASEPENFPAKTGFGNRKMLAVKIRAGRLYSDSTRTFRGMSPRNAHITS